MSNATRITLGPRHYDLYAPAEPSEVLIVGLPGAAQWLTQEEVPPDWFAIARQPFPEQAKLHALPAAVAYLAGSLRKVGRRLIPWWYLRGEGFAGDVRFVKTATLDAMRRTGAKRIILAGFSRGAALLDRCLRTLQGTFDGLVRHSGQWSPRVELAGPVYPTPVAVVSGDGEGVYDTDRANRIERRMLRHASEAVEEYRLAGYAAERWAVCRSGHKWAAAINGIWFRWMTGLWATAGASV